MSGVKSGQSFKLTEGTTTQRRTGLLAKIALPLIKSIITLLLLGIIGLGAGTFLSGGRLGLFSIKGNSLSSIYPSGSVALVLPLRHLEGDLVSAWGTIESSESHEDGFPELMIKKYEQGRLISTDSGEVSRDFDIRGKAVACLHVEKVLWWRDKGIQKEASSHLLASEETIRREASAALTRKAEEKQRLEYLQASCLKLTAENASIVGGQLVDGKILAEQDVVEIKFSNLGGQVRRIVTSPCEFWGLSISPSLGNVAGGVVLDIYDSPVKTDVLRLTMRGCKMDNAFATLDRLEVWIEK